MIDLAVVAKALNSIDLDDLLEAFDQVTEMGHIMSAEDEQSHPLNQAMMRIFTNQPFMEAMQRKADRLGVELDAVLFPMLQGLLIGLITPVQLEESTDYKVALENAAKIAEEFVSSGENKDNWTITRDVVAHEIATKIRGLITPVPMDVTTGEEP